MTRKANESDFRRMKENASWYHISYTKEDTNESTNRTIIPIDVPKDVIKAIDVTDLSIDEMIDMREHVRQYLEYIETQLGTLYKFEDFVELTAGKKVSPKWRTFKKDNIDIQVRMLPVDKK